MKCLCVIIAPIWEQHCWFEQILKHSTHFWKLPTDACTPLNGIENQTVSFAKKHQAMATFTDFRFDKASSSTFDTIKSIEHCHQLLKKWKIDTPITKLSHIQKKDCVQITIQTRLHPGQIRRNSPRGHRTMRTEI